MINKYKEDIINRVYEHIDWKLSPRVRNIAFACDNINRVEKLSGSEFSLFRNYVKDVLSLSQNGFDDDNGSWAEIRSLFSDIQNCEHDEFIKKYSYTEAKQGELMRFLPPFCLELTKFFILDDQLCTRNHYQRLPLPEYKHDQRNDDYLNGINVANKEICMQRAKENIRQPNHLKYIDVSLQSDKELMSKPHYEDVYSIIKGRKIPLTENFKKQLIETSREIAFLMLVAMLDSVNDRNREPMFRQVELQVWGSNTPFNSLFQYVSLNADGFKFKEGKYYNWKEVLNMLSIEEFDIDADNSDIYISKENNNNTKNFVRVPASKYKNGYDPKQKDMVLYKCLKKLYNKLYENNAFESPCEEAFIYRFSGFNKPDDLKMKWIGRYAYLGKLIRCLYEDKDRGFVPAYKQVAEFMGLKNNIAAAGKVQQGSKGTDDIVKLLTECGFINVDVFEDSYGKKRR